MASRKLSKKEKSHALKIARRWVRFKLKVENPFNRELRSYFHKQYKNVKSGRLTDTIAPVLDKQYKRIIREITGIKLKQENDEYNLEDKIKLLLLGRATLQAMRIDKTTKKYLERALEMARQELQADGILFPAQSTVNKIAAQIFKGFNSRRIGGISTTETQMLTEKIREITTEVANEMMEDAIVESNKELARAAADLSESLTLESMIDDIGAAGPAEMFATLKLLEKSWVTMGDKKVRDWHNEANYQTVPIAEPFIVMGELLMHPGDTSLGASMENVANCRCSRVNM